MIDVDRHGPEALTDLADEWASVMASDPDATVFQSASYLRAWTDVLGTAAATSVLVFRRDEDVVGVAALEVADVDGARRLRFLGGEDVTDYLGPLAAPHDRAHVADALVAHVAGRDDWDEFVAGGLAEDVGWPDLLRGAVAAVDGLTVTRDEVDDVCPRVDLAGGVEGHRERLDAKERHEQERKTRKLAREVGAIELVDVAPDDLAAGLTRFFELAASDPSEKGAFFRRDDMREWFHALADALGGDDTFRLQELHVDGLPTSSLVSLVHGREWGLYNSAFDDALGSYAPGVVHIALLVEEVADDHDVFDLLRGDEPYKYRFAAVDRTLARLTVTRTDR